MTPRETYSRTMFSSRYDVCVFSVVTPSDCIVIHFLHRFHQGIVVISRQVYFCSSIRYCSGVFPVQRLNARAKLFGSE